MLAGLFLQLQRAVPMGETPLLVQVDTPGNVFERQIDFGTKQCEVEFVPAGGPDVIADPAGIKEFDGGGAVSTRLLLERDKNSVLLPPGPDAVLVDEREPELS